MTSRLVMNWKSFAFGLICGAVIAFILFHSMGQRYRIEAHGPYGQVITADYRSHQLLVWQALASPAPSEETMQQTIDRLSTTYKLPQDVLASLIMDDLFLSQADEH